MKPLLECQGIHKSYGSVQALTDVDFALMPGEVVGLLGENGAGKSTLAKILTGALSLDRGTIRLQGRQVHWGSPSEARADGVVAVHQEPSLVETFSIAENVVLGNEPVRRPFGRLGLLDAEAVGNAAVRVLSRVGIDRALNTPVRELSIAEAQLVELARALVVNPRVLVLDEATSRLMPSDVARLFAVVKELKSEGVGVIFISHRLEEVLEIADRVYVLKDGRRSGEVSRCDMTRERMIQLMVGRELPEIFPSRAARIGSEPVLSIRGVGRGTVLQGVSLDVFPGEVLGIGGLEGHGQQDLVRGLAGLAPFDTGEVSIASERCVIATPVDAIRRGILYLPEDRRAEGLIFPLTVTENVLLPDTARRRFGFLSQSAEHSEARVALADLAVKAPGLDAPISALSGGNQQKVMFAKWLRMRPRLLLLHEPTRGVDIKTRLEIYRLIRNAAADGVGIVLVTSDMMELLNLSTRIAVFYEGRLSGLLSDPSTFSEERVMRLAVGEVGTQ